VTDAKFFDPEKEVLIKCITSKICPNCEGYFKKNDSGYECTGCGLRLDENGKPLPIFYGVVTVSKGNPK
jgi:hypothetical protein